MARRVTSRTELALPTAPDHGDERQAKFGTPGIRFGQSIIRPPTLPTLAIGHY
jgi:hypothetical protein